MQNYTILSIVMADSIKEILWGNIDIQGLRDNYEFKEDSVREEIILPLLRYLGYKRENIVRSLTLQHPFLKTGSNRKTPIHLIPDYVLKIENMAKGAFVTVHIMGELTFVYAIVSKLKQSGIECYASTSERNVVENNNGLKTSIFKFVNFRRY